MPGESITGLLVTEFEEGSNFQASLACEPALFNNALVGHELVDEAVDFKRQANAGYTDAVSNRGPNEGVEISVLHDALQRPKV